MNRINSLLSPKPMNTASPVGKFKDYGPTKSQPLTRIAIYPGYITYESMTPLIASDGAPISATSEGTWGQLFRAGRM